MNLDDFEVFVRDHPLALIYFSSPDCAVCKNLQPKVRALVESEFPQMAFAGVNCAVSTELAVAQRVFGAPTVVLYIEGREASRKVRAFGISELREMLARPYRLFVGAGE